MGLKRSTIKRTLAKKLNGWLDSITDENVRAVARANCIVTGGAITSYLLGERPNDYDVYFKSMHAARVVAEYYVKQFNEMKGELKTKAIASCNPEVRTATVKNIKGEEEERLMIFIQSSGVASGTQEEYRYFETESEVNADEFIYSLRNNPEKLVEGLNQDIKLKHKPIFMSQNAISLSDKIQLIIRFHGTPEQIHENFDFIHATGVYDLANDNLSLSERMLESVLSKSLIYSGSLYPVATIFRLRKFIARGWRISAGQLLKILHQISYVDFEDYAVLREQLLGVDAAYMYQLVAELQKHTGRIDEAYLAKLIDEIFEGD